MSFRSFLFAADALRLEEGFGFHVETPTAIGTQVSSPADNKRRNAEAMQNLMGMMAGVQKGKR